MLKIPKNPKKILKISSRSSRNPQKILKIVKICQTKSAKIPEKSRKRFCKKFVNFFFNEMNSF